MSILTDDKVQDSATDLQLERLNQRRRLSSLIFGSAGYGSNCHISVDSSDYVLPDPEDIPKAERHVQFPNVSMLLEALDDDEDLKALFQLSRLDDDLAFALRHVIIYYLQRISQYGATATGLMIECLTHFMQEHPSHDGCIKSWREQLLRASTAPEDDSSSV